MNDKDVNGTLGQAKKAFQENQWEQARSLYRQVLEAHPESVEAQDGLLKVNLILAEQAEWEGAWSKARALYQDILDIRPDHFEAQDRLLRLEDREKKDGGVRELIQGGGFSATRG